MSSQKIKWLAQSTIYRDSIDLLAIADFGPQGRHIGQSTPIVFTREELNTPVERPTLELSPDSARSLMQALWDAGIRPADLQDPSGEVRALKGHVAFAEHVAKALLPAVPVRVIGPEGWTDVASTRDREQQFFNPSKASY